MIDPKKLSTDQRICLRDRFCGTIFGMAVWLDIWFDDAEIKYIETKMMTHKLYRLVNGNVAGIKPREGMRLFDFQRSWLLGFLDDKSMPIGVRAFIHYYIGHEQARLKINDKICETKTYETSINREFLVELWMNKCR